MSFYFFKNAFKNNKRCNYTYLHFILVLFFCFSLCLFILFNAEAKSVPEWWGNSIGKEEIVLPGFSSIDVKRNDIFLGAGRRYTLGKGIVFQSIESKNRQLVQGDSLLVKVDGVEYTITSDSYKYKSISEHHVEVDIKANVEDKLEINISARIEYDGIVMINIDVNPLKPVAVEKLYYGVKVVSNDWTKMLMFKPETTHKRQKKVVFDSNYKGGFLNALSVVDGSRSFWWFADNAEGWLGPSSDMTEINKENNVISITQKLINKNVRLTDNKAFGFNLMVTPVKEAIGNVRQNRHARRPFAINAKHQGLNVWWTSAFVHQIFPYTDYPPGVKSMFPISDIDAYPGLVKNIDILEKYKSVGIERLPYFSAHMINQYDPYYQQYLEAWQVYPKKVWNKRKYDRPFKAIRNEAYLTHRGIGYSDYLIYRFSKLIDELGFEGLYFDQGGVLGSSNPRNGLWIDDDGNERSSTDILAMRDFHKRLATLLYIKGKKSLIFSHNSNTAIVPAYSFITAMVQGEEYIHWLKNYDYIDSIGLDEVRTRLGSAAFGLATMWQEVLFAKEHRLDQSKRPFKMSKKEWLSSNYYQVAYNNFMTLALLHDMPVWGFAPIEHKNNIFDVLDWVEPETSKFVGYWEFDKNRFDNSIVFSYYISRDRSKAVVILANLRSKPIRPSLDKVIHDLNSSETSTCKKSDATKLFNYDNNVVKEKSFALIQLDCEA